MMENTELLKYKIRNLIHYWKLEDRPHAQYVHILNDIKEQALEYSMFNWDAVWDELYEVFNKKYSDNPVEIISRLEEWYKYYVEEETGKA